MQPGPIPWTAIAEWAQWHGITDEQSLDELVIMVRAQDQAWLAYQAEQKPAQSNQSGDDRVSF